MRFTVTGADRETGEEASWEVECANAQEARRQANDAGYVVSSVKPTPVTSVEPKEPDPHSDISKLLEEESDELLQAHQALKRSAPSMPPSSPKPVLAGRPVKEVRATCTACGHIWHYKWGEEFQKKSAEFQRQTAKATCFLATCGLAGLLTPLTQRKDTSVGKCPKCGSSAISRETVTCFRSTGGSCRECV